MLLNKPKRILSDKKVSILIVVLAIAARIALQLYFFDVSGDRSFQLAATKSFVEGHGFSLPQVLPNDLHKKVYLPLVGWPPGYSIFLSPLYFVFNRNIVAAAIAFEVFTSILFVFFSAKLLQLLNLPSWLVALYTLTLGFFIYDFASASSTDFQSLTFFLIGIYYSMLFIKKEKPPLFGSAIAIILFLPALTRYMYASAVLIPPLYLLWTGYVEKNKRLIRGSFYCFVTLISLLTCLFVYQHYYTGSAVYLGSPHRGFYPSHLLRIHPFLFSPFLNIQIFCTGLHSLFGFDYVKEVDIIRYIHLIPFVATLFSAAIYFVHNLNNKKILSEHFVYIGLLSCFNIIFLLIFLSVTNAPEHKVSNFIWTYVEEPRYYAFVTLFIQQLVFIFLFNKKQKRKFVLKIFTAICAVLLTIQVLHGIYFVGKKLTTENHDFTIKKQQEAAQAFFYASLDSLQNHHPNKQVVSISNDITFQNLGTLKDYSGLYKVDSIDRLTSLNSTDVIFLVVLPDDVRQRHETFLQQPYLKFIGAVGGYYFYTLQT